MLVIKGELGSTTAGNDPDRNHGTVDAVLTVNAPLRRDGDYRHISVIRCYYREQTIVPSYSRYQNNGTILFEVRFRSCALVPSYLSTPKLV